VVVVDVDVVDGTVTVVVVVVAVLLVVLVVGDGDASGGEEAVLVVVMLVVVVVVIPSAKRVWKCSWSSASSREARRTCSDCAALKVKLHERIAGFRGFLSQSPIGSF
jgi:hypothetical protein